MRIVLLGGAGFIGYHLAKSLSNRAEVMVVGRQMPSELDRIVGVTYQQGDCNSVAFLKGLIKADDYIIFLAYNSVPKTSFDDPLLDIRENIPLAITLLEVLRDVPIKRLLYVSSGGTVYGHVEDERPIDEGYPTNPISPYGITKLSIEKYCLMYWQLFGIPVVIVRPSNPFGPRQIPYRGQGFVPTAVAKILRNEEIAIFGEHGTIRDYLYIDDLVSAMMLLLDADIPKGSIYNIGSAVGLNNIEVISRVSRVMGLSISSLKIDLLPPRHFDVAYNVLDSSKLNELGWSPAVGIDEGLSRTVEWLSIFMEGL